MQTAHHSCLKDAYYYKPMTFPVPRPISYGNPSQGNRQLSRFQITQLYHILCVHWYGNELCGFGTLPAVWFGVL